MCDFEKNILEGLDKMAKGTHPITCKEANMNGTSPLLKQTFQDMNKILGTGGDMVDTFIQGIPCTVEVKYHKAHRGARDGGLQLEPDEDAGFEIINVFKRGGNGNHMAWLEDKMTDEDRETIFQKALDDRQGDIDAHADFLYECIKEERYFGEQ
jgi:hypothetical protein